MLMNPENRPIFMDPGKIICDSCEFKDKKEDEEPCVICMWVTTNVEGDVSRYKKQGGK